MMYYQKNMRPVFVKKNLFKREITFKVFTIFERELTYHLKYKNIIFYYYMVLIFF